MLLVAVGLLGLFTGARSMTPVAAVCWFAYFGRLHEAGTWAFWAGYLVSAIVFTVAALGEYVGDKLPMTPNRTHPFPLGARVVFGGLVGAVCATGLGGGVFLAVTLGAGVAAIGTWATFHMRRALTKGIGWPDLPVALAEDVLVAAGSVCALLLTH